MELYKCVRYEDLKEGEPILALALHAISWKDWMPEPAYGFVPVPEDPLAEVKEKVYLAVKDFMEAQKVTSIEVVYQSDRISGNALEFITELFELIKEKES